MRQNHFLCLTILTRNRPCTSLESKKTLLPKHCFPNLFCSTVNAQLLRNTKTANISPFTRQGNDVSTTNVNVSTFSYPSCFPYCSESINRISVLIVWSVNLTIDTKLSLSFFGCRKSFLVVLTMWFTYGMPLARLASEEQSITPLDLCTL